MFTCDTCHRQKPNSESVPVGRWAGIAVVIMTRLHPTLVCRRCSLRVKKLGIVALVGLLVISIVTLLVLDFVGDFLS